MTETSETTTTARTIDRITDDAGTAYTAIVETVDPDEHPALEQAGFHSETTLYTVCTPGEVATDYDRHRLAREKLPGNARWVVDALRDLEQEHEDRPRWTWTEPTTPGVGKVDEPLEQTLEDVDVSAQEIIDDLEQDVDDDRADDIRAEHQPEAGSAEQLEQIIDHLNNVEENLEQQLEAVRSYVEELADDEEDSR